MSMYFVHEFVEVMFVALTQVDEGLDGLVGISRNILFATFVDHKDHVVDKDGEIGDTVVDVGGLVDSYQGLVKDCEEIFKKLETIGDVSVWQDNNLACMFEKERKGRT